MTIKEIIKKQKQEGCFSIVPHEPTSVDVYFTDDEGGYDATQFDLYSDNIEEELDSLFTDFCKENHFPIDTVTDINVLGYIAE